MANTPDNDRFYEPNKLLRVFAISSIIMLIFTIWMILDDFGREWKGYQREFMALKQKTYTQLMEQAKGGLDQAKLKEMEQAVADSNKELEGHAKEEEKLKSELVLLKTREKNSLSKYQGEKAVWDVRKYEFESVYGHKIAAAGNHEGADGEVKEGAEATKLERPDQLGPKAAASYDKLEKHWGQVVALQNLANTATQNVDAKQKEIDDLLGKKKKAEKDLKTFEAEVDRLHASEQASELTLQKVLRSSPIIDMANPVFRLQQIVLPTIRDDIYFAQVQKVDRCITCHQAIDTPGFENAPQPFKTHPNLDLILGSRSPHPTEKIGCTVCHEGRGQSTDFVRSAHTPRNEEQEKEWKKKYGWHEMHHVIEKMIPLQYIEGKCHSCHKKTEYVAHAEKLTASTQMIKAAGCYGCHKIEGWEHVRKPAPSLKRVKGKLTRDWIVKWVSNPKSFNDHARMPSPFFQSNIVTDEHRSYNEAEVQAISDFLLDESESYEPDVHGSIGSVERGKALFKEVGCLGCHQVSDFGQSRGRYTMAPDLSTIGSKVSKDWLLSWITNPSHFWSETTMPNLRLTREEAGDIAAFLLSKKNPEFEQAAVKPPDPEVQKKVLRLYLMRDPKMAPVTDEKVDKYIADLKPHDVTMQLAKNAISRYGCYGCHEIKGYETTPGIGVELTEEGSKPVNKLDFGLMHLDHTNHAWFHTKLENTRIIDRGLVKEYLDLLRMPNYGFDEHERNTLITSLMGMTSQKITPPAAKALSAREELIEEGVRVVHKYNCQGCHTVEALFTAAPDTDPQKEEHDKGRLVLEGRILEHFQEDETLGPPPLVTEGARVQSDWVHGFLKNPGDQKLRWRLKVRMPTFPFTNDERNKLLTYWANHGNVEFPYMNAQKVSLTGEQQRTAKVLFTKLQCLNCHTVGERPKAAEMEGGSKGLAPDLSLASKRLRKEWIVALLKDPQKMIPGTRMPGFWPDGNTPAPELLGGNSEAQIDLLADYVLSLGQRGTSSETVTKAEVNPKGARAEAKVKKPKRAE